MFHKLNILDSCVRLAFPAYQHPGKMADLDWRRADRDRRGNQQQKCGDGAEAGDPRPVSINAADEGAQVGQPRHRMEAQVAHPTNYLHALLQEHSWPLAHLHVIKYD